MSLYEKKRGISLKDSNTPEPKNEIKKLKEDYQYVESILSHLPQNIYWMNKDGKILGCNDNQARCLGFKNRLEMIGKNIYDIAQLLGWPASIPDKISENDRLVMRSGGTLVEEEIILINNEKHIYLSSKNALRDDKGEVIGVFGISTDITDRKRLEQELQESKVREEHFKTLSSLGGMIAHEMRTPLRAIDNGISGIKEYLPKLIEGYEKAKTEKLNVPFIHPMHYQALIANSENLGIEVRQAFLVIDMLLMKARQQKMDPNKFTTHSMSEVVKTALERYPFTPEERAIVHADISKDFNFKGDELALVHVFFNLLKNALHYIKSVNKGEIYITTVLGDTFNELHFKDTGPGISKENLEKLFDAFFTSGNAHGTGLGLAFCKMVMQGLGGDITCDSVEGKYTEFVLKFPKTI